MQMKMGRLAVLLSAVALTASSANGYQCNDRYYVNAVGQVVHAPSCGTEPLRQTLCASTMASAFPSIIVGRVRIAADSLSGDSSGAAALRRP
jgi:hypothetical protein